MIAPKVAKPTPAESKRAYDRVKERSFGVCEICGVKRATEIHHRLYRSQGGQDTIQNLLAVCGFGNTSGCHGKAHTASERYENGWAIESGLNPATTSVVYRGWRVMLTAEGGIA